MSEDDLALLEEGDRVYKPEGYIFPGVVRSIFSNGAGQIRLVVESELAPGMLHIFSPKQVELQ